MAIAIKEEASADVGAAAARCHWISLGELSSLIEICKQEGLTQIMMAGQVKHAKIFSSIRPDWRLDQSSGRVAAEEYRFPHRRGAEGASRRRHLAGGFHAAAQAAARWHGQITKRNFDSDEERDIEYGRRIAHALASMDLGQSVAIADRACVALEAMEGTDAMLRRAASLVSRQEALARKGLGAPPSSSFRCSCHRAQYDRRHDRNQYQRNRRRRRAHLAAGPRRTGCEGECSQNRNCRDGGIGMTPHRSGRRRHIRPQPRTRRCGKPARSAHSRG